MPTGRMRNFYERFAATAERCAARVAIEVQRSDRIGAGRDRLDSLTYAELQRMAEIAAGLFTTRGIAPADRCAILADNDAAWCASFLAILRLGAVAVPLDTAYKPKQIAALVRDSGAKILLTTPRYLRAAEDAWHAYGLQSEIVLLHGAPIESGQAANGVATFDGIKTAGAASLPDLAPRPPRQAEACPATRQDPAVILYTSGTTSDPKGVVLTHGNLLAEIEAVLQVVEIDERDSVLGVLPLFHALALMANLLLPFSVGARVVFLEAVNTTELLRALRERGPTAFCCVPQFFYLIHQRVLEEVAAGGWAKRLGFRGLAGLTGALRKLFGVNLGPHLFRPVHAILGRRMRLLVTGGSPFDPQIGRDLYRLGFDLLQAYGLTECAGAATVTRPGKKWTGSVGTALLGVEIKILAPESPPAPPGQAAETSARDGEVAIRGPIVMQGYFNRPDANAAALRDGWLHTGDLGYLDSRGRLTITGRKKEVIVLSSGKNIYPEEIEAHYLQSPYLKELCVMGLARPDEPSAERLHAIVVPDFDVMRERKVLNTREILRYEIERLSVQFPSHKRILSYEIWTEELPRTSTRKLKRFEIERRVQARAETLAEAATPAAPPFREEELAWAADPGVASALALIGEAARYKAAIRPDANIELDLGLDSIERVELLTRLQQRFGTQVPDEVAQRIYTVRDMVEAVRRREPAAVLPTSPGQVPLREGDGWGKLLEVLPEDDLIPAGLLQPKPLLAALLFVAMKSFYLLARLLLSFRALGREHLPRQRPFLLCPNHQSFLDPFLLVSALPFRIFRNLFSVGASEYFATPLRRWLARKINIVPVDPNTHLLRAMRAAAFGLRHGKVLILFPEGERSIDGQIKKFKKGASILSLHLRAPIVPVAFDGVFGVWPRARPPRWRAFLPGSGARITMRFGAPLPPPPGLPADTPVSQAEAHYSAAAEQLRSKVLEMRNDVRHDPVD